VVITDGKSRGVVTTDRKWGRWQAGWQAGRPGAVLPGAVLPEAVLPEAVLPEAVLPEVVLALAAIASVGVAWAAARVVAAAGGFTVDVWDVNLLTRLGLTTLFHPRREE
jgi:hypothetical protein